MNKTLIAATVAGIVLLASNAQAQTVPEGYQLQQVLMMSRHNLRARWRTMAVCWSSRRRINGQNGTSPVGNSPPKVACSKCIWAITCVNGWQNRGW